MAKRRRPQAGETAAEGQSSTNQAGGETLPSDGDSRPQDIDDPETHPAAKEKEWIKIAWSPRAEIQRPFSVVVTYNRTSESVEVSNTAGEIVEALNLKGAFKLLKEKYGAGYEVFASVRLKRPSAFECQGACDGDEFQSLDNEEAKWSWILTPGSGGKQIFNLELWVKGEPREGSPHQKPRAAERVWSKENLEVEVKEPVLTRNTILASSVLFTFVGVGFSIRGIKIYRVGDTYNVENAVAVGRNVTMNNTTVNQNSENTNVGQKKEDT